MSESRRALLLILIKPVCLAIGALIVFQVYRLGTEEDPLADLDLDALAAAPGGGRPKAKAAEATPPAAASQVPERQRGLATTGVLGTVPRAPPPPALLGIAGKYAILRAPDGQSDLVAEGGQLGGVKLIKIGMNRVLIEYQGKVEELSIFSGLGSPALELPGKERPQ